MDIKILNEIVGDRINLKFVNIVPAVPEKQFVDCCNYDICLKDGTKIGEISAKLGTNEFTFYIGNVGYSIDEQYRGYGYAVEAVKLIKKLFKENGFKRIVITQVPENKASKRVCEKLGARFLGVYVVPLNHLRRVKYGEEFMNIWELDI